MDINMMKRIEKLRKLLRYEKIDAYLSVNPINRRYISGFTGSTGYAVISEKSSDFATDFRYFEQVAKECPGYELIEIGKDYTIYDYLKEKSYKTVAVEEDFMTVEAFKSFEKNVPETEFVYGAKMLNKIRMIKSEDELELFKEACKITDEIMMHVIETIKAGMTEKEINALILSKIIEFGGETYFFMPIVASGERSSMPHGKPTDKRLENGDFVIIDMGIIYKGYFSDMTRTVVIGKAADKQRQIYDTVLRAQLEAVKLISAGMTGTQADRIARDVIEKAGYGQYFGHALGHGFNDGLVLSSDSRGNAVLEENMVFTIEPGIYIENYGGVRIEDTVILTKDGCIPLYNTSKELIEIL
ncbi:M24 family metallopeptidase [Lutispora saccharofermentans]|uniref:Xaa-Pro peptidase family protein n=1 Tax=Lutispora saccharofermentans TaxID=3024236 RepID=A0ABT1NDY1_9FIRM|nr:Xaa-Pro peptidase family protein [Lutispora saccharofermentans]MCQ1528844.1 Xaa-Pro peptidase family protein [Lutispora saccharofermentans]